MNGPDDAEIAIVGALIGGELNSVLGFTVSEF